MRAMSETQTPRTRRYVLGCVAAGLAGTSMPALAQEEQNETETLQQTDPDGKIITLDSCATATVEGDMWNRILVGIAYYENGEEVGNETKGIHPADDGITRIDVSDQKGAVIEDVACYKEGIQVANASRENPEECIDEPITTTAGNSLNPSINFNGCNSVTVNADRYTIVSLVFTDGTSETFRGEWDDEGTYFGTGENAGKKIKMMEVSNGSEAVAATNPNNCSPETTTDEPLPFDPRFEYNGCESVRIYDSSYTLVELKFTDHTTQTFKGNWEGSNTFQGTGKHAGKNIMEVTVTKSRASALSGNPNDCAKSDVTTTTGQIHTVGPDPTTTTEVILTPHDEPTTTTAEQTTTGGGGLIDWLFGLL